MIVLRHSLLRNTGSEFAYLLAIPSTVLGMTGLGWKCLVIAQVLNTTECGDSWPFSPQPLFGPVIYGRSCSLPKAYSGGTLDLPAAKSAFKQRWYNPRTGEFEGKTLAVNGGSRVPLGTPPTDADEDWVVLIKR